MLQWVKALLCACSLVMLTAQCRDRSAAPSASPALPPAEEPAEDDPASYASDAGAVRND
jgi:hypothetical protein